MIPLVFILLVTAVLIAMVAWILSSSGVRSQSRKVSRRQDFDFEAAKETAKPKDNK